MRRMKTARDLRPRRLEGEAILWASSAGMFGREIAFTEIADSTLRHLFDRSLDEVHYAGSCQRVGRCMRLAVTLAGSWVGGVVLGSTFPNIDVRDEILGMKRFVRGYASRGLKSPWSRANRDYWDALQTIVNHARTFVFPEFQGQGIGIRTHSALLTAGVRMWEKKYSHRVYALDTLCDQSDSGLFLKNGWVHAGETRGYTADFRKAFSHRQRPMPRINNAALRPSSKKWQVWIRVVRPSLRPK
jgi:GNAT superfamily N-acetyltransferase